MANRIEPMTGMVQLLLELGGDLTLTDAGNFDFVAMASVYSDSVWSALKEDASLLAKCTAWHAGRVALQLQNVWRHPDLRPEQKATIWSGETVGMFDVHSNFPLG